MSQLQFAGFLNNLILSMIAHPLSLVCHMMILSIYPSIYTASHQFIHPSVAVNFGQWVKMAITKTDISWDATDVVLQKDAENILKIVNLLYEKLTLSTPHMVPMAAGWSLVEHLLFTLHHKVVQIFCKHANNTYFTHCDGVKQNTIKNCRIFCGKVKIATIMLTKRWCHLTTNGWVVFTFASRNTQKLALFL